MLWSGSLTKIASVGGQLKRCFTSNHLLLEVSTGGCELVDHHLLPSLTVVGVQFDFTVLCLTF